MNSFLEELQQRLSAVRQQGLERRIRSLGRAQSTRVEIDGQPLLNFSSNDYLGLANEPILKQAAIAAVERYGAGAGASRLICGSLPPHEELDQTIAGFKRTEAALSFSTGYAAALGVITALLGKEDLIILDRGVHASIIDAARLCGARMRVFAHNNLNDLESILVWAAKAAGPPKQRVLIVTESVFSMDGDRAPLPALIELKHRFGAWLMVDEAHATGLYGPRRAGLAEEYGLTDRIEIHLGTLGKAIGAAGGYICGARELIEYLINRARSFIFSTAPVPAAAGAAIAGIQFIQSPAGEERWQQLWRRVAELTSTFPSTASQPAGTAPDPAKENGQFGVAKPILSSTHASAIVPIIIGDEQKALDAAAALRAEGIFVPAIRYPSVARRSARLRVTLSAAHASDEVCRLATALKHLGLAPQIPPPSLHSHAFAGSS